MGGLFFPRSEWNSLPDVLGLDIFLIHTRTHTHIYSSNVSEGYLRAYVWWAGLAGLCFLAFVAGCIVGTIIADSCLHAKYELLFKFKDMMLQIHMSCKTGPCQRL